MFCENRANFFLEKFLEQAKEFIEKDEFYPIAIPIKILEEGFETCEIIPLVFEELNQKEQVACLLDVGASCFIQDCSSVVIAVVGYARRVKDIEYTIENYETERPSLYPESMRDTVLIITYLDIIEEKFLTSITKIKKLEEKKIEFEEPQVIEDTRINSGSIEMILHGWNLMYRFIENIDEDCD